MAKRALTDDLSEADRAELVARLRSLVERFATQAEAARVAGVSLGQIKAYIAGRSAPSFLPVARLARAAGVDLNEVLPGAGPPARSQPLDLDPRLFGRLFDAIGKVYQEMGVRLPPSELGALVAEEYKDVAEAGGASEEEQLAMVRLVAARHRRLLQEEKPGARKRGGSKSA